YDTATLAPYYKVTLTAVATYDTNGNGGISGVGNSASVYYAAGGAAPSITSQPSGQTVAAGAKITFTVAATGTAPLTYQWSKDGSPISGATSASYVITTSKAADSGTYTVVVTNGTGTATSDDAVLVVDNPPVITTQPTTQTVSYGASVIFSVAATSAEDVTYQWKKAGVAISGQTGDTCTIPAAAFTDAGSYTVVVTNSLTGGSATSSAATLTVTVPAPSLSLASSLPIRGSVSVDLTGGNAVSGVTYFATGLPTGLTLNATTGQITGTVTAKAGAYTITYWAQYGTLKSTVQTMQVTVTTFPSGMVGSFEGLLEDGDGLPAGEVSLVVTTTGTFTGKLIATDTKTYALKGTLALNGDYSAGSAALSVARGTGITPYSLTVSVSSASVFSASLAGVGETDSGVKLKTYAKGETSVWAGAYTLTFGDLVNLGATTAPEGHGYATAKIGTTGSLVVKGKLADGTALTGTFAVAADGSYRWYVKPYKTAGNYLGGWLTLTERADTAGRYEASSSDFYWKKPAVATDKLYPAGFGPVGLTVELQKWVVPVAPVSLASLIGLDAAGGALALTMDGGGLTNDDPNTYTLPTTLTLGATGLVTVADATNPTLWNLKVKTTDGSFSGSFTLKDGAISRKVTLQGVLLQQPSPVTDTVIARGYYLVSPLVSGSPTLSGALEIALP
ncbi:MAG TPA: immunoglobulin domain-containing protein, partial [Rariglobus sp.]